MRDKPDSYLLTKTFRTLNNFIELKTNDNKRRVIRDDIELYRVIADTIQDS